MTRHRITLAALALATASLALAGCSAIEGIVYQRQTQSFPDAAAMRDGTDRTPAWVPSDATSITLVESTREGATDAAVLLVSESELDPAVCAPIDRQSGPMMNIAEAPDVYAFEKAFACGEWTVAASDDGWYGWTPNHPDEEAQSPR